MFEVSSKPLMTSKNGAYMGYMASRRMRTSLIKFLTISVFAYWLLISSKAIRPPTYSITAGRIALIGFLSEAICPPTYSITADRIASVGFLSEAIRPPTYSITADWHAVDWIEKKSANVDQNVQDNHFGPENLLTLNDNCHQHKRNNQQSVQLHFRLLWGFGCQKVANDKITNRTLVARRGEIYTNWFHKKLFVKLINENLKGNCHA